MTSEILEIQKRRKHHIEVVSNRADLIHVACELILAAATISVARRGVFRLALAGGSTPKPIYEALAATPDVDWRHWQFFWGDERTVPPDHPESNYRMAQESFIDQLTPTPGLVMRMAGELDPTAAAETYQGAIRSLVPPGRKAAPHNPTLRYDPVRYGR